ncbi:MAG TPA: methylmalonyl-CoA epimerase [bacterium]|nr:methylmalonyl-CoA epimerase [bacterium]
MKKINHIGIAVEKIDDYIAFYRDTLGLPVEGAEMVEEQKVKVAFLTIGDTRIELLEPTSPESPIAKFIEKKGAGVHHLAFEVDDIAAELAKMKEKGVKLIDETPRGGAHHTKIAFIHPKESKGVLVELTESGSH